MTIHSTQLIPENAPFTASERALLNDFFVRAFALDQPVVMRPTPVQPKGPLDDGDDGAASWHDPAVPLDERMQLAATRPLRRRMMAAMGQQDCGQCGYNCEDYANSIFLQAEPRLNLCVPGGKATARMLKALVEEMGGGVLDPDEQATKISGKPSKTTDERPGRSRGMPVPAVLLSRRKLNGAGSQKATYHIEIDLTGADLDYQAGDSFGILPANDPALVDRIIAAIAAPPDFPIAGRPLRDVLIEEMSLGPAPDALFQFISYVTGGERRRKAQALANGKDPDGDAATLDVLAALEKFTGLRPDPEAFIEALEPLQPRLYSISSSPRAAAGRVSITVDMVRYEIAGRRRTGVASSYLCERASPGGGLKVYIQKAHGFGLPANAATPIIMVGPGTGIAPFRAFLHERALSSSPGRAWLFFGHQHEATDFFYREELEQFLDAGVLTKLSTAWSRDSATKVYVQDRMRQEATELWAWLQAGAHFYVCGDALRMAKDVETAMVEIAAIEGRMSGEAAKAFVAQLKASDRYQADVY
jgi:sulfite reductase (NADPH) flavoprotein alpha-component